MSPKQPTVDAQKPVTIAQLVQEVQRGIQQAATDFVAEVYRGRLANDSVGRSRSEAERALYELAEEQGWTVVAAQNVTTLFTSGRGIRVWWTKEGFVEAWNTTSGDGGWTLPSETTEGLYEALIKESLR